MTIKKIIILLTCLTISMVFVNCCIPMGDTEPVVIATTSTTPPTCPSGWTTQAFSDVSYCYLPVTVPAGITWADAEAACVALGVHLASIHSAAENTYVYGQFFLLQCYRCLYRLNQCLIVHNYRLARERRPKSSYSRKNIFKLMQKFKSFVLGLTVNTNSIPPTGTTVPETWIGLKAISTSGTLITYAWTDGTIVDYPTAGTNPAFTQSAGPLPWAPAGEPDGSAGEGCTSLITATISYSPGYSSQNWDDLACSLLLTNYVCKKLLV